jgi:YD repeat-containing protein
MSNRIKSETVYRIDHVPGEEIDPDQEFESIHSYREFDGSGNLVLEVAYTRDGEIADKIARKYDPDGRLTETCVYGEDEEILERKETVYDRGRIAKELTHYLDGSYDVHEFFYDEEGKLTGMTVKDDEDEPDYSEQYFYEGEKVVKVERLDAEGELIFKQEDEYSDGVLVTRTTWSAEDEEPYTVIQRFTASGHLEEEMRYNDSEELIERNIYEEDKHGRVARLTEENRQRKNTTEFEYDEKGNVVHQVETNLNGELNHEVFRFYGPDGEPVKTTVEAMNRLGNQMIAYTLVYKREFY